MAIRRAKQASPSFGRRPRLAYRIEPPQSNDDLDPVVGHLAGRFNLILPGSDDSVTYESLAEAKEAAEQLYQLDASE